MDQGSVRHKGHGGVLLQPDAAVGSQSGHWGNESQRSEGSRALPLEAAFPGALPAGFPFLLQTHRDTPVAWSFCAETESPVEAAPGSPIACLRHPLPCVGHGRSELLWKQLGCFGTEGPLLPLMCA